MTRSISVQLGDGAVAAASALVATPEPAAAEEPAAVPAAVPAAAPAGGCGTPGCILKSNHSGICAMPFDKAAMPSESAKRKR